MSVSSGSVIGTALQELEEKLYQSNFIPSTHTKKTQ